MGAPATAERRAAERWTVLDEDYSDVDLAARIAAVKREVALRERVYPKLIASGKMTREEASKNERAMRAVLQTLLRLQQVLGPTAVAIP